MRIVEKSLLFIFFIIVFLLPGCGKSSDILERINYMETSKSSDELSDFKFDNIMIYCSPSLEKPVFEIKNIFEEKTGCEVQVNVTTKEKMQRQIKNSKYGELIITDAKTDLDDIYRYIEDKKEVASHKPVLAVKKGEFPEAKNLDDLIEEHIVFLNCGLDTGIGDISHRFYDNNSDEYIFSYVDNIKESEIYNAVYEYENSAAIVWKESSADEEVDIIEIDELNELSSSIMLGKLKVSENDEAVFEFVQFFNSDEAKEIWMRNGYDVKNF